MSDKEVWQIEIIDNFSEAQLRAQGFGTNMKDVRKELNDAVRAYDGTQGSIDRLTNAQKNFNTVSKDMTAETGRQAGLVQQLGSAVEGMVLKWFGIGAIWMTMRTAWQEIQKTNQAMQEYSMQVAQFAVVTDSSISEVINQYRLLRMTAEESGFTPNQAAPGIIQAARYQKTPGGQQELYTASTKLAEALGLQDTTQTTIALGNAMRATGKSAMEMADLIVSGYKMVGGDASEFMRMLPQIQTLSDETGISLEKMFSIIVNGAATGNSSFGTLFNTMHKFSQDIDALSGDKLVNFINALQGMGIAVQTSNGQLASSGEIISAIGDKWQALTQDQQEQILTALGAKRGAMYEAGRALFTSFGDGMVQGIQGAAIKAADTFDSSFGEIVKRIQAKIAGLRAEGNTAQAFGAEFATPIMTGIGSLFGGAQGGRRAAMSAEINMSDVQQYRQQILTQMRQMNKQDAETLASDFNAALEMSYNTHPQMANELKISTSEIETNYRQAGTQAGNAFDNAIAQAVKAIGSPIVDALRKTAPELFAAGRQAGQQAGKGLTSGIQASLTDFQILAKDYIGKLGTPGQASFASALGGYFPTAPTDLTKMSQEQINQAKQLSLKISQQELNAIREQAIAMGLTAEEANKIVEARKRELDQTTKLLQTQQGMSYQMGQEVANIDKAVQMMNQQQKELPQFQFQRLQNVDSSQFPQLQALAQMYNQFLSNIGSPEKNQNVSLLLGDNTFKTMNIRLTALQLALEDLTKVEKAQLSGTWNLPAGATALVPIRSLDLQRWNNQGGGGLTADAIRNLMSAFSTGQEPVVGATHGVKSAVDASAQAIVTAIRADRMTRFEKQDQAQYDQQLKAIAQTNADRMTRWERTDAASQGLNERLRTTAAPVNVSVGFLPIKTNLAATVNVLLDGQVIARSLMPFMYEMIARAIRGQAAQQHGSIR